MKRVVLILMVLGIMVGSLYSQVSSLDGSGTESDPYLIQDLQDLITISDNSSIWDKFFIQTADIDASSTSNLNEGAGFSPIGNNSINFAGSYDGQNHIISNLYINRPSTNYIGLFGYIYGYNQSHISNVGIVDNETYGNSNVGGFVGKSYYSTITNSYATGTVNGNSNVGGFVGHTSASTSTNSYATGAVNGNESVGGLVGWSSGSTITNSYATGTVNGDGRVGGLVGYASGCGIMNSYATGTVNGDERVGGLVGYAIYSSSIRDSYATGTVNGDERVGGLVGDDFLSFSITNSFWDTETSGQNYSSGGGTGQTTAGMQTLSTYIDAGWDFVEESENGTDDIWIFVATDYPHLAWENYEQQLSIPPVCLRARVTEESINLYWNRPQIEIRGLIGYNIFRNDELVNDVMITDENYNDIDIESGQSYNYYVTAVFDEEESEPSNIIEVLAFGTTDQLSEPYNLQININGSDVILNWEASAANLSRDEAPEVLYIISYQDTNGIEDDVFYYLDYTTELSYTHVNIGEKNRYMLYGVRAYSNVNNILQHKLDRLLSRKRKLTIEEVESLIRRDKADSCSQINTKKKSRS